LEANSPFLLKIFRPYLTIEPHIRNILMADFFIQIVNSSFFLLLNYLMDDNGYKDFEIARFRAYQYVAVMLFAFPLGVFIRGRKIKPLFYFSTLIVPAISLVIIYAVSHRMDTLLHWSFALWGISYSCLQVPAMPFILQNAKKETHTEAIVLFFLTNSTTIALCGFLNFLLNRYMPQVFDEKLLMQCFALLGFGSFFFIYRIKTPENTGVKIQLSTFMQHYDWGLILKALTPTLIIAVGAGFTIPFVNLFFLNVHGMQPDAFSLLGATTFLIVAFTILLAPTIKRKLGYGVAVTLVQSLSVFALIMMTLTQYYNHWMYAVHIAGFFYLMRQPLMNLAAPVTSELGMYYVGKRNHELMSAFNSSIWSGSWFISSLFFGILRESGMSYAGIFFITAALYSFGVFMYHLLIQDYKKRKSEGLTEY